MILYYGRNNKEETFMKKLIALILTFVLVLGLVACGNSGSGTAGNNATTEGPAGSFRVGYGKENITPDGQVGLGGYGRSDQRLSTGILSYLWVTCIAITDAEDNTILLYGMDLLDSVSAATFLEDVSSATGVPIDNIVMSASHAHSTPDYTVQEVPGTGPALKKLQKGLIDAALTALEDRKPAEMYGGSVDTAGMNFVRHYVCNDGSYFGDNYGSSASGLAGHTSEADPELQVVKFVREGDNEIWMTNFQTHPHQTGGATKYDVSADIVGELRTNLEKDLGVEVLYFTGAAGNINSRSRIAEENVTADWREWGKKMAEYAKSIEFTKLNTGKVQAATYDFTANVNHADDANAAICGDLRRRWDAGEITTAELIQLGESYGIKINSPYHANAISNRSSMGESGTFPIQAFSFGDVGLVAAPYEMFDTNGMFIKENSPFSMTFIAECANGSNGYFPTLFAFSHGSYEADITKYVPGTAEALADQYVAMLTEQYNNR